jgi:hypothetical protein
MRGDAIAIASRDSHEYRRAVARFLQTTHVSSPHSIIRASSRDHTMRYARRPRAYALAARVGTEDVYQQRQGAPNERNLSTNCKE